MSHRLFPSLSRRSFIKSATLGFASFGVPTLLKAHRFGDKKLYLYNIHTGEWFKETYWENGTYIEEALQSLNHFMRDRRTGDITKINPNLFDLIQAITQKAGSANPVELICGYRCPKTNASLCKTKKGVAKKSLHMSGRAADIRLVGTELKTLRDIARAEKKGGVGYYPRSQFIHVDIRPKPAYW
tara:strand:- start:2566 stop:3120 length:555 start_codon:yes stop_codon:yes gene_type:complete